MNDMTTHHRLTVYTNLNRNYEGRDADEGAGCLQCDARDFSGVVVPLFGGRIELTDVHWLLFPVLSPSFLQLFLPFVFLLYLFVAITTLPLVHIHLPA
jgi:hypothetical protein